MKKLCLLPLVVMFLAGCQTNPSENALDQATLTSGPAATPLSFGEPVEDAGEARPAAMVSRLLEQKDSVYVTLTGTALTSCAKKGCWMTVALADGHEMRVTFKDYGFFVPKDLNKEEVVMEGVLKRKVSSVDELRHYAEDAGKSSAEIQAITQPDTAYAFEAVGVLVYRDSIN